MLLFSDPRQEQSQPQNRLVRLRKRAPNRCQTSPMLHCLLLISRSPTPCARHANGSCATVQSVVFSYPEVLYRSFGFPIIFILHESHWQSINAEVASPVFCLHQWRVPQFALKYLCNPPPPRETVARYGGKLQGGEGSLCYLCAWLTKAARKKHNDGHVPEFCMWD